VSVRPADVPPPWRAAEAIAAPTDPPDERIDVGVAIVGAGPAGLAAAIRLGQLMEEDPATAERLGEVPVAVLEKGKAPGSHLLSGAVVNPRGLQRLFRGRKRLDELPFAGPVEAESVLFLTQRHAYRIPTPPTMVNHHNHVASLSRLGRWLAEEAEAAGATVLPETPAVSLLVDGGRVVGVRTGDRGRGRRGERLANFEAGSDVSARVTILAEGTQGHLTGAALETFRLSGENPQVWALGVKEVWRVPRPLRRVIHTMGWPLRGGRRYREFGGSFVYPLGDDMVTIGMVVGLDYRDTALSVHDLLQELKTHPRIRRILEGGERLQWGAKTIPEGGFVALPRRFHAPGLLLCGDGAGFVNVPALKGIHYAIESGRLAAEAAWRAFARGTSARTALATYDDAVRASFIWSDLREVRNMRQAFGRGFWLGGALAGAMTATRGRFPGGDAPTERDAEQTLITTRRASRYPVPDGRLTFDKLSSVFASGNRTRDDQPNHIRVQRRVPRQVAELWVNMCPAQVYELVEGDGGGGGGGALGLGGDAVGRGGAFGGGAFGGGGQGRGGAGGGSGAFGAGGAGSRGAGGGSGAFGAGRAGSRGAGAGSGAFAAGGAGSRGGRGSGAFGAGGAGSRGGRGDGSGRGAPDRDELVEVRLAPSNCVQCGAITARGGRLTPPEGGSGPEYTIS
jgi:electron-transferring-flavoprotein dehydrogenase